MEIKNGYASTMELIGIPYALNGWTVYCDFSNNTGHTQTTSAKLTVTQNAAVQTTPEPTVPAE